MKDKFIAFSYTTSQSSHHRSKGMSSTTQLLPRSGLKLHFSEFSFSQNHSTLVTKRIQVRECLSCKQFMQCVYMHTRVGAHVYMCTKLNSHQHQK